jgi:hypothetical protein
MPFENLTEFLKLSSALNYNLSAASVNRYNVMMFIMAGKRLARNEARDREHKAIVMEALAYLFEAYRDRRRRLGPMAVLHPLRTAAIMARSLERLDVIDLLAVLFHDVLEDIEAVNYTPNAWKTLEGRMYELFERLDPEDEWRLNERLQALTRFASESYYQYIGRLLERSRVIPRLVAIKMADRLDNTLDLRIELTDPFENLDFFEGLFNILFVTDSAGNEMLSSPRSTALINDSRRLYQLFKNAVLLSMIRRQKQGFDEKSAQVIFDAICAASLKEAQRTLIHVAGSLKPEQDRRALLRELTLDAMHYCHEGRISMATRPDQRHMLDGLFSTYFAADERTVRAQRLDDLFSNKPLMIQASIAFIVIFTSFRSNPDFYVRGISTAGVEPE